MKSQKKLLLSLWKILSISFKNGNTKDWKFVKQFWEWIFKICNKKWHIIDSETKGNYSHHDPIKFLTKSIESSLCDCSDAYILVTGDITVTGGNGNKKVAFKNCLPFKKVNTEIIGIFVDEAYIVNIAMPMYDLIQYSNNYSDTLESLWQFKWDEIANNANICMQIVFRLNINQVLLVI